MKIENINHIINISDYYNNNNRLYFKTFNDYVILPGKENITQEISNITGIKIDSDYFDL